MVRIRMKDMVKAKGKILYRVIMTKMRVKNQVNLEYYVIL